MKKDLTFYGCIECDFGCIYSHSIWHQRYDPRKPKYCIIDGSNKAKWKIFRKFEGENVNKLDLRYFCEQCNYLCMVAPLTEIATFSPKCPIWTRYHKAQVDKVARLYKKTGDSFWESALQFATERLIEEDQHPHLPQWKIWHKIEGKKNGT